MFFGKSDVPAGLASPGIRQHTRLTYWPKYGGPIMFLLAILAVTLLVRWDKVPAEAYVPIAASLAVLFLLAVAVSYLLHFVFLTDEEVIVKRYGKAVVHPRAAINSIRSVFINLYVVEMHDDRKYYFLPRVTRVLHDLFRF
ncbi:hypothetical protein ACFPAF_10595 [Hymenobacter endophyticus]|uniref:PH domain-containing protein n=1 Tax=Hymenobacter endophyticus TaxID=3076335 RepID=A0ABU3THI5_9BACT|nr:hypothetical protein [Hymenobacter endophyticus]MDU0370843.1 hypothetical protein [Hymenobacter endophyticus]